METARLLSSSLFSFVILQLALNHGSEGNISYFATNTEQPIGAEHPGECTIVQSGINKMGEIIFLNAHNRYRNKVALGNQPDLPSASNMNFLRWDEGLARTAQEHADRCQFKHHFEKNISGFDSAGQNVYMAYPDARGFIRPYRAAVDAWFDEYKLFTSADIKPFVPGHEHYGHFTQMIWADVKLIGCGYTAFLTNTTNAELIVCNYGPRGNVAGLSVYETGTACSECETCSVRYRGLCVD